MAPKAKTEGGRKASKASENDAPPPLSEYELHRERRIRENAAKLAELGLGDGGATLKRPPRARKRKATAAAPTPPARRSSRLANIPAPEIFLDAEGADGSATVGGADADAARGLLRDPDALPIDADDLTECERAAYEVLRAARNERARAMERSMFIVCNDRSMAEMVRTVPRTLADLGLLYGMGPKKVAAHGKMLLAALAPRAAELDAHHDDARKVRDAAA